MTAPATRPERAECVLWHCAACRTKGYLDLIAGEGCGNTYSRVGDAHEATNPACPFARRRLTWGFIPDPRAP